MTNFTLRSWRRCKQILQEFSAVKTAKIQLLQNSSLEWNLLQAHLFVSFLNMILDRGSCKNMFRFNESICKKCCISGTILPDLSTTFWPSNVILTWKLDSAGSVGSLTTIDDEFEFPSQLSIPSKVDSTLQYWTISLTMEDGRPLNFDNALMKPLSRSRMNTLERKKRLSSGHRIIVTVTVTSHKIVTSTW